MKHFVLTEITRNGERRLLVTDSVAHNRVLARRKRTSQRGKAGAVTREDRIVLLHLWGCRCAYWGSWISQWESVVEHLLPVARGGMSEPENLAASCAPCNAKKGILTASEFGRADVGERAVFFAGVFRSYWKGEEWAAEWLRKRSLYGAWLARSMFGPSLETG